MNRGWLDVGLAWTLLCGAVAAGIVHIVATFATPELLRPHAFDRIAEHLPANTLVVLGQPTPQAQLLPYQEPDTHFAICSYDVSGGPVQARVALPASGWTLALYSPEGDNFYLMPGRDQRTTTINALLVAAGDEMALPPVGQRSRAAAPTYVQVPAPTGLLVIRAPLKGESYRAEVEAVLARASCGRMSPRAPVE
ncbi:MAG: DUF1254 domain-containing protein [Hyphomicrobiaceae bacterium]|nr:DUF1254 domain-containing protein [Hyphomicrobiaceae bacterium]